MKSMSSSRVVQRLDNLLTPYSLCAWRLKYLSESATVSAETKSEASSSKHAETTVLRKIILGSGCVCTGADLSVCLLQKNRMEKKRVGIKDFCPRAVELLNGGD